MQEFKAKVQELIDRYDESLSQNGLVGFKRILKLSKRKGIVDLKTSRNK